MTILTTGIRANNAPLVARQELRTFLKDVDLMNLYLLALKRMQDTNQNDLQSWFQVAGIHGRSVSFHFQLSSITDTCAARISHMMALVILGNSVDIALIVPSSFFLGIALISHCTSKSLENTSKISPAHTQIKQI